MQAFTAVLLSQYVAILMERGLQRTMGLPVGQVAGGGAGGEYPYRELFGPLPRLRQRAPLRLRPIPPQLWKWPMTFLAGLLEWLNSLQWIPGPGEITFLELVLDYEAWTGSCVPEGSQWDGAVRGPMPLSEKGRVLRVAMVILD